ncbi:competence/damage-inducible protein A [Acidobacteriota bacterium]
MNNREQFKVEFIAVGSELLLPYFKDTNSLYLTKHLNDIGMDVSFRTIVGDDWDDLILSIQSALSRADIIFTIGGLGPTYDDRTREAFSHVLGRKLIFKKELLEKIEERFRKRGIIMPRVNEKQAYIFKGAQILENRNGTAPGLWLDTGEKIVSLLPGPPHELKPMFETYVLPRLQEFKTGYRIRQVLKITGLTESKTEAILSDIYPDSPYLKLILLASPGQIEIHLTSYSDQSQHQAESRMQKIEKSIVNRLKRDIFSTSNEELEEVVGKLLSSQGHTLATAESCTGGLLGHRLTNVPGSSKYFLQSMVVYSNESKNQALNISASFIEKNGAVSAEVAQIMAIRTREIAQASLGLAITGIAGPGGSTPEKPVGLVYIALAWDKGIEIEKNLFLGNREIIKFQASQKALDMLRRFLLNSQSKIKHN